MREIFCFDNSIHTYENVVICGTDEKALVLFVAMLKRRIHINYFLTDEDKFVGSKCMNKKCISLSQLHELDNAVLLVPEKTNAILDKYLEMGGDSRYVYILPEYITDIEELVSRDCLSLFLRDAQGKEIHIFGNNPQGNEMEEILGLCDIDVCGYYDTEEDGVSENVWELLYTDFSTRLVIVTKDNLDEAEDILKDMGLKETIHYRTIKNLSNHTTMEWKLDVQLGHTYQYEGMKECGIRVFGELTDDNFKIVTLGGSTTDPQLYPFKSWSEILYNIFQKQGKKICIICAGCSSYTSAQELLKLERDLILYNPDLVISYSGVNDIYMRDEYKFASQFMRGVMKAFPIECISNKRSRYKGKYFGKRNETSVFDWWLYCERSMHAICIEFGIDFIGIWQAMFRVNPPFTEKMREILLGGTIDVQPENIELSKEIREVHLQKKIPSYIVDFSSILDDYDEFIDGCHVTEYGNRIIAERIYELIRDKIR